MKQEMPDPERFARLLADSIIAAEQRGDSDFAGKFFENGRETVLILEWLAKEPNNMLAAQLASPAMALVKAIGESAM